MKQAKTGKGTRKNRPRAGSGVGYISYSEFTRRDKWMGMVDELMDPFDLSEIDKLDISNKEKEMLKAEALEDHRALFDHRHPINIYLKERPRVIQAGTGMVREGQLPSLAETWKHLAKHSLDPHRISFPREAVITVIYDSNDPHEPKLIPAMHIISGLEIEAIPSAALKHMLQIPSTPLSRLMRSLKETSSSDRLLRESAWLAKQVSLKGIFLFLVEIMALEARSKPLPRLGKSTLRSLEQMKGRSTSSNFDVEIMEIARKAVQSARVVENLHQEFSKLKEAKNRSLCYLGAAI